MRTPGPGDDPAVAPQAAARPESAADAVAMVLTGLGWLAGADLASAPPAALAEVLRGLERAASVHLAARSRALAAFTAQAGYEEDGHGSPRTWLRWQTKVTLPAANAAMAWARRLNEHPAIDEALAATQISVSWARQVCEWTDALPEHARGDADVILLAAARNGAQLADLANLAEGIRWRVVGLDGDSGDGFEDRSLRLATTLGGAGRLNGDLDAGCAAALQAVLDALAKKQGPADTRTKAQRDHDALAEACRRLIASNCLPDRAGQPLQIQLSMTLQEMLDRLGDSAGGNGGSASGNGGSAGENGGTANEHDASEHVADAAGRGVPAWPGAECDAQIAPVVIGRVDHDLLDRLAGQPRAANREQVLANAIALLSGPGQLASVLRTGTLPGPAASISLPLDLGKPTDVIPPHLRRAVIIRDRHCAAPGCYDPPAACHVHHVRPRSQGGKTCLTNLLLLCTFHHEIAVHRWGWTIRLNPDGTTSMTSPHGERTYHSHAPPESAAA